MQDQLIGYLIGSLEPEEHRAVEARLQSDPELRRQLALLEHSLEPLAADAGHYAPPVALAERTCQRVLRRSIVLRNTQSDRAAARWSWTDMAVAAGIFLAASLMFFPAVQRSRHQSRLAYCQNNLRNIGLALAEYSQLQGGYLPYVPPEGYAGWYAPTLVHKGFIDSSRTFVCPGSTLAKEKNFIVPRIDETLGGPPEMTLVRQRTVGGSYGYSLSHVADGHYQPLRYLGRSTHPVMSDAPALCAPQLGVRQLGTAHSGGMHWASSNHDALGQNILFEDGHSTFLFDPVRLRTDGRQDLLFVNDTGIMAAGISSDDTVIGTSDSTPSGLR